MDSGIEPASLASHVLAGRFFTTSNPFRRIREFRVDMYTMLNFKWITSKDLLYSTGNFAPCYVAAWIGGEFGREWTLVYMAEFLST